MADFALRGPSLTLRLPRDDDAVALFRHASDRAVTANFSWGPYVHAAEALAWLRTLPAARERGKQLELAIDRHDEGLIGVISLSELSRRDRRAMVGTWLGRPHWGTGANAEAKALVFHLAFALLGLERLGAYAAVGHGRSQRALEKVGFRREGVLRHWHRHGDAVHDVVIYGLLATEWCADALPVTVEGTPPAAFVVA
ncbi:MAG TPA: GNAT family N-acetyltransferase [Solirubrobacteraceae bacterium]|nr:GNAT family N-acetyltransferase [Solirubrobacteraceae bacterium]